ncbi:MAG: hypothetical protein L0H31_04710 [Nocardioidaceae bacterium]|nr:hypothetical protein [Nocardioidaceae bacterium]
MTQNHNDDHDVMEKIMLLVAAAIFLPMLIPAVLERVAAWSLAKGLVVPSSEAVVTIPTTDVGVDARRIVIVLVGLVLIGLLHHMATRTGERR